MRRSDRAKSKDFALAVVDRGITLFTTDLLRQDAAQTGERRQDSQG
jgi:hypothetical protein